MSHSAPDAAALADAAATGRLISRACRSGLDSPAVHGPKHDFCIVLRISMPLNLAERTLVVAITWQPGVLAVEPISLLGGRTGRRRKFEKRLGLSTIDRMFHFRIFIGYAIRWTTWFIQALSTHPFSSSEPQRIV